jgi:threonine synthase
VVTEVSDIEILDAKAVIDRAGIGCEPASAASLAGAKKLVSESTIRPGESVALVLTGHVLKDSDTTFGYHMGEIGQGSSSGHANRPVRVGATLASVQAAVEARL